MGESNKYSSLLSYKVRPLAPSFPRDLGPWDQWTEFLRPMKTDVKPLLSDRYQAELHSWRGYAMKVRAHFLGREAMDQ